MQKLFLTVLDMSIMAGIVILAVLVIRLFMKKVPKIYSYILWVVVLFRLLCPFTLESSFSLIPKEVQNISRESALDTVEHVSTISAIDATQRAVGDVLNGGVDMTVWVRLDNEEAGVKGISYATHGQILLLFMGCIWPVGVIGMVIYGTVSYARLKKKLVGALNFGAKAERIYLSDYIESPFVLGMINPKIYLPSNLSETEREYIILHEKHHIQRKDPMIKGLAFAALCIHWFNPLVWIAFSEAGKDMEMSCDEAVIRKCGVQIRADYSESLLKLATGKNIRIGMPLAFGEGVTGGRIKNISAWKKPKLWISILSLVVCGIVTVICIVNPKAGEDEHSFSLVWDKPEKITAKLRQGSSYISYDCLYMNLLSSTLGTGDSGYRYVIGENEFTIINRYTGDKKVVPSVEWEWQEFPWSKEQWNELFFPGNSIGIISEKYEEMLYQPISARYCILSMDEELWLMELHKTPQGNPYVWSIYGLKQETVVNAASAHNLNQELLQYVGMSVWEYRENVGGEFQFKHGNFFEAKTKNGECEVVFCTGVFDPQTLIPKLADSNTAVRLEGKVKDIYPGIKGEMTVEELVRSLAADVRKIPYYEIKGGAGTIYYVSNDYVEMPVDKDNDGFGDLLLQIELDESGKVQAEASAWLCDIIR